MNFDQLIELSKPFYTSDDPSHDFAHIKRVMKTSRQLGEELGANLDILLPAALLHDVVNVPKNHPDRARGSELAAEKAAELLKNAGYEDADIPKIQQVIIEHSFSRGDKPSTIESEILQDADRLDGIGAIGIMRATTVGTKFKASYYCEEEPLVRTRELNDKKYTLDHFFTKLYKLPDLMNTKAGKLEADRRVKFMQDFVEQLLSEAN